VRRSAFERLRPQNPGSGPLRERCRRGWHGCAMSSASK
jgi:hypothetical protein